MASAAQRPEGFLRSKSARGSPDWPSALISLSMPYSTRRIESVAPSIKRYDANLPTIDLRQQTRARRALLDWLRRLAGSAHSAIAGILQTDIFPCRNSSVVAILARRQRVKYHQVTRRQVLGG